MHLCIGRHILLQALLVRVDQMKLRPQSRNWRYANVAVACSNGHMKRQTMSWKGIIQRTILILIWQRALA